MRSLRKPKSKWSCALVESVVSNCVLTDNTLQGRGRVSKLVPEHLSDLRPHIYEYCNTVNRTGHCFNLFLSLHRNVNMFAERHCDSGLPNLSHEAKDKNSESQTTTENDLLMYRTHVRVAYRQLQSAAIPTLRGSTTNLFVRV